MVLNSHGLGTVATPTGSPSLNSPGWANACGLSFASYLFDYDCWGEPYSAWQTAFYATQPGGANALVIPGPPPLAGPPDMYVLPDTTGQAAQDISNAQISAAQAAIAAANPPPSSPIDSCTTLSASWPWPLSSLSCSTMLLVGIASVFGLAYLSGGRR
jgi:hypothetical protein